MRNPCLYTFSIFVMVTSAVSDQTKPPCATIRFGFLPSILDDKVYFMDQIKVHHVLRPLNASIRTTSAKFPNNCYHRQLKRLPFPREQNDVMQIYDKKVLEELSDVDVIIGEYRRGVHSYAKQHSVAYIITTPANIQLEKKIRRVGDDERVVFSTWPSWKDFFSESIQALIRLNQHKDKSDSTAWLGRVLIICPSGSKKLGVALELLTNLIFSNTTTWTKMMVMDSNEPWLVFIGAIFHETPDIVVFMYDDISELKTIDMAVKYDQRHRIIKGEKPPLLFWDMTKDISGTLHHFLKKSTLADKYFDTYTITAGGVPMFVFGVGCDDIKYDMTPAVGAVDAIATVSVNAVEDISSQEFNKRRLLSQLRKTSRIFSSAYISDSTDVIFPIIFPGRTYRKGFKYHFVTAIGRISPTAIKANGSDEHTSRVLRYENCKPKDVYSSFVDENMDVPPGMPNDTVLTEYDTPLPVNYTKEDVADKQNIVVVLAEPFAMKKTSRKTRNSDFTGFAPELTQEIVERMRSKGNKMLEYKLYTAPGNHYGSYNTTSRKWSGAMGELQNGNAVMAIGMISKTKLRARDFDFSPLFEYVGLTYIRQKYRYPATMFNFMRPFEVSVWCGILVTVILSAVFIYILEYWNPFLHKPDGEKFTWSEVIWYSFCTMSGAGGSFAPTKTATRLFSVVYWFCALVLTATYTGNLASFLTESYEDMPSGTIESLGHDEGIKWVTLRDSYMDSFIRTGESFGYKKLARQMEYVESYDEGVARVKKDQNYAFIGNNLLLHLHEANAENCALGISHDMVGFNELAFPMARDWWYTRKLYDVMIEMRDDGKIKELLAKWIQFKHCSGADDDDDDHIRLHIDSFYGLFMILAVFIGLSFLVLAFKLIPLKLREKNMKMNGPQQEEHWEEEEAMTDFVEGKRFHKHGSDSQ